MAAERVEAAAFDRWFDKLTAPLSDRRFDTLSERQRRADESFIVRALRAARLRNRQKTYAQT